MKKLIIRIGAVIVVLLILTLVAVYFSLGSIVKKGVETVGPKLTKVEMRLGGATLSPLSGQGRLTEFFVGNPEGYKTPSAIKMGDIKVGLQIGSVFSDTVVIDEINIQSPEITLEGSLASNNLGKILDNLEAATGADKAAKPDKPDPSAKKPEKTFFVKDLVMKGGKIHLSITTPLGGKTADVALPELHLQNIGSKDVGVTAAELSRQVLKPVLASATKVATDWLAAAGNEIIKKGAQDLGKGVTTNLNKTAQDLKNLFKK